MPVVLIRSMPLAKLKLESTRNKSSPGKIRISVRNLSRKVSYFNAGVQLELCKCCKMHKGGSLFMQTFVRKGLVLFLMD